MHVVGYYSYQIAALFCSRRSSWYVVPVVVPSMGSSRRMAEAHMPGSALGAPNTLSGRSSLRKGLCHLSCQLQLLLACCLLHLLRSKYKHSRVRTVQPRRVYIGARHADPAQVWDIQVQYCTTATVQTYAI